MSQVWRKGSLTRIALENGARSLEMMDWVIEEVTFKAETFLKKEMVIVLDGDVVKSNIAIKDIACPPGGCGAFGEYC